jgi:hypothetical protein
MANANSTPVSSNSLLIGEYWWGKLYRGSEADLIASGLVKPEWLPGKPGNPKHTAHLGLIDGSMKVIPYLSIPDSERRKKTAVSISKEGKRFLVRIHFSEEEQQRIEEESQRQRLKEKIERQHAEKKKYLDDLPKSPDQFSAKRSRILNGMLGHLFNHYFCRADGGYHYSLEVIEKARDLITEIIEFAEEGKVYFDKVRYQYALDDIEESTVKAHPEFSAFMATTLAIGKVALDE